jgi:hypothetical protein
LRIAAAISYVLITTTVFYFARRKLYRFLGCLLCFALIGSWWLTLKPSNNEPWQTDVSRLAFIDIRDGHAITHEFRQCDYRAEFDYTCKWSTLDVDLAQIRGVDLFMDYWGSPWIAHTIVSFDVGDGQHVAFSIETRKQTGQSYSAIRGFFRQYTLISIGTAAHELSPWRRPVPLPHAGSACVCAVALYELRRHDKSSLRSPAVV